MNPTTNNPLERFIVRFMDIQAEANKEELLSELDKNVISSCMSECILKVTERIGFLSAKAEAQRGRQKLLKAKKRIRKENTQLPKYLDAAN